MKELSPKELADVLESGKYNKGQGSLGYQPSDEDERHLCCLGVYAEECDLPRVWETLEGYDTELRVKNPTTRTLVGVDAEDLVEEDPWLASILPDAVAPAWMLEFSDDEAVNNVMQKLASLNDESLTWRDVINYLRSLES